VPPQPEREAEHMGSHATVRRLEQQQDSRHARTVAHSDREPGRIGRRCG
jgi:hypothetical protein